MAPSSGNRPSKLRWRMDRAGDRAGALDTFMRAVVAPNWKSDLARTIPGGPEQAERDVRTVFEIEMPSLAEWDFDKQKAQTISQPILHGAR